MFGTELYAAMVEEEANDLAIDRRRRQTNRPAPAPSQKDIEQDAHIRLMERENRRLKSCFAGLVQVLLQKGVMTEGDVREIIQDAQQTAD